MALPGDYFEVVNGALAVMYLWVVAWFLYDVLAVWRDTWDWPNFFKESAASIACAVAFTGDFVIRAAVWYYRHLDNDGMMSDSLKQVTLLVVAGGVLVAILGSACIIRHLAPSRLGDAPWVFAVLTAILFGIGMAL